MTYVTLPKNSVEVLIIMCEDRTISWKYQLCSILLANILPRDNFIFTKYIPWYLKKKEGENKEEETDFKSMEK